ncbi:MAG: carboxymuconolactone decarboxylase family protein [Myxococcota bacterium]
MDASLAEGQIFDAVKAKFGFVPNVIRELAASPAAVRAYLAGQEALESGRLSPAERQLVQYVASKSHGCGYCSTAHGGLLRRLGGDPKLVDSDGPMSARDRAIVHATRLIVDSRGQVDSAEQGRLAAAGVDRSELLEIVALVAMKVITNYTNHIAQTKIDPELLK